VQPIYAGSYQDTIVKALTAHKAGTPPVASVLLSTDTFTLIDEDAVVPIDNFVKTAEDRALAGQLLQGLPDEQPDRRQDRRLPAQHHRAVLEQGALQGGWPGPEQAARHLGQP
jgi:sn-glycerol 3-phosphate transport system substrate-binding protein